MPEMVAPKYMSTSNYCLVCGWGFVVRYITIIEEGVYEGENVYGNMEYTSTLHGPYVLNST